ncbi:MAG: hypothetical protein HKN13_04030 [Rhodothermales bacterium]|nr:hypothetical protein [Rhodothermales bacterium]
MDSLTDPHGVVLAVSRMEPGYFRTTSSSIYAGSRSRVHVSRLEIPDKVALPWDSAIVPLQAAGDSARAA